MGARPAGLPGDGRCVAISQRSGERCKRRAIAGSTVCYHHGGAAPQVRAAAARRLERARLEGDMADILAVFEIEAPDPVEGLLEAYRTAYATQRVIRVMVADLEVPGEERRKRPEPWHEGGWYGPDHQGDGAPHVLVTMLGTWTDRLAKVSDLAIRAGIEQRRLDIAAREGRQLVAVLQGTAIELIRTLRRLVPGVDGEVEQQLLARLPEVMAGQVAAMRAAEAIDVTGTDTTGARP